MGYFKSLLGVWCWHIHFKGGRKICNCFSSYIVGCLHNLTRDPNISLQEEKPQIVSFTYSCVNYTDE